MQPKCDVKFDEKSFDILKRTIKNISIPKRERIINPKYATELPESVGIKLTNRCNLRCRHCYQWNSTGYHKNLDQAAQNEDISIELFQKILKETCEFKSRLYLWGGEPLYHNEFAKIAGLLEQDPREVSICTNGILIDENLEAILKVSSDLELLIGLEGFQEEHDAIRGKGTFKKTINNIELLLKEREKGNFKGKISIHTVITDNMISKLYDLLEFYEQKGIDLVLLCFPWYLSEETSKKMNQYVLENLSWLIEQNENASRSWHAFKYRISTENIENLTKEIERINNRVWKIRIRYQPGLEIDEIEDFISGNEKPGQRMSKCLAVSTRMDVTPDGSVVACKHFIEFAVGNLAHQGVKEVWNCQAFEKIRETINCGLMPVCSKCNSLYLHGS